MTENNSQPIEQSQPKLGPGERLQSARINIGLTLEDVAVKMHLSSSILTSLENNNFEDITAPIFVKGYLRAYSRLVNVDEDEIIQQYSSYNMEGDPPISSTSNTSADLNADDSRIKWITYLVILGLIVLLSAWWWSRYQESPETVSLDSGNALNTQTEIAAIDKPVKETEAIAVTDPTTESLQQEIKSVVENLQVDAQPTKQLETAIAETEDSFNSLIEQPIQDATDSVQITPAETASVSPKFASTEADSEEQPSQPANDKDLVITVNADTWASIKDATGKKLVYDLLRSGEQITVTGQTPIRAFLGNGYGVSMKYQGKDIDLSSSIQPDNTARIKIGQ